MAADYIGRFAPSPTGPLHLGSLVAAVGSWLDARARGGRWLLRIEDIDPLREHPGAAAGFPGVLAAHGLHWDGEVTWQSRRRDRHATALLQLRAEGLVYACRCSRKALEAAGLPDCLGPCRQAGYSSGAWRLRAPTDAICFSDRRLGPRHERLQDSCGDFVLWRRDDLPSYQLAVVVDDAAAGVTDVVRGADLLDNTARQCWLQTCLRLPRPRYLHLPLITGSDGRKLSKQSFAPALDTARAAQNLRAALGCLGLQATGTRPDALLASALEAWQPERLPVHPVPAGAL